jgi:murein DD-endopeptidase MepM/ murein hydrolase activator NlpD
MLGVGVLVSARIGCALLIACLGVAAASTAASAANDEPWAWPLVGPVIRSFDAPDSPYGSGHRGIDIAAPVDSSVRSPAAGVVAFAGSIGGELFVAIDHGGGLRSTYSWLASSSVDEGDAVFAGGLIARSGAGHPGASVPHLHFGAKREGTYVDPLNLLAPPSVVGLIRLVPLEGSSMNP